MKRLSPIRLIGCAWGLVLAGCAAPPPRAPLLAEPVPPPVRYAASFDCKDPHSPLQELVCGNETLASLDREMGAAFRRGMGGLDLYGRAQLIADQRRWLLNRLSQCRIPVVPNAAPAPDAAECLKGMYRARTEALGAAYRLPVERPRPGPHPLSAYVAFRLAQDREPALCGPLGKRFDEAIADHGQVDPSRIKGLAPLAGTHRSASFVREGSRIEVLRHEAGPYASYQVRAKGLARDGQVLLDDKALPDWVGELPNAGGNPTGTSSQTGDYASIEVFGLDGRQFALVTETWGYYAAAARGESPHAGLYELVQGGGLQPRCLYRTYLTPPAARIFDRLPALKNLTELLAAMSGELPPGLAPDERLDETMFERELAWTLLNMPLLVLDEIERFDRRPALRRRHDAALEAIFAWSERNLPSKLLYRRLLPALKPAHAELSRAYASTQGLKPDEAAAAAELFLMMALDRAADSLDPATRAAAGAAPRYAPVPAPGDLEKNRRYANLHSALLNRASPEVIADYTTMESALPPGERGRGPAGDTALMAALRAPDVVAQLLATGADPNGHNDWHKTALMTAAQTDQLASAQLLLAAGADVQRATVYWQAHGAGGPDNEEGATPGRTALMYAAAGASAPLLRLLLDRGVAVHARDLRGRTACDYLAQNKVMSASERDAFRAALCVAK